MTVRTQLAYAAAGLTLILGLLGLLNPVMAARVLGLEVVTPRGLAEMRSVHGALFLTAAGLMLWAIPVRPRTAPLLRTLGLLIVGAAVGRAASVAIDGWGGPVNLLLLVGQAFVGGAIFWAAFETRESMRVERARRAAAASADRRPPPPVPPVPAPADARGRRTAATPVATTRSAPAAAEPAGSGTGPTPDGARPPAPRPDAPAGDSHGRDGRGPERR